MKMVTRHSTPSLLVADDTRAYVGSANFLRYRKNSLELGVMVKGHTARTIRFISEALKEISGPVLLPALAPFGPKKHCSASAGSDASYTLGDQDVVPTDFLSSRRNNFPVGDRGNSVTKWISRGHLI